MVNEIENSDFILDSLGKTDYDGDMNAMHWESNLNNSNILVYGCSENPFLDIEHPLNDRIINVYKRLAENRTDFKNYLEMLVKNNYLLNPETQQSREIEFIKEAWSSWDWVYPYVHEKDNN